MNCKVSGSASALFETAQRQHGWPLKSLKWLARFRSGDAITSEEIGSEGPYPVFGGNGLRGSSDSYTHDGDYVLVGRQGALCGNINYATGKFWASEHAVVVSPYERTNTRWLGEMLRTLNLNQYSVSAAQPGLAVERIVDIRIAVPPLQVQHTIGRYLDRETARIDALIEKKTRFIELLREKRQALITQTVTQGLDPSVPMKDSGVAWLGRVPAHWEVRPLKFLTDFRSGGTPSKENQAFWHGDIPWASAKDLKTDRLGDTQDHLTTEAIKTGAAVLVPAGAVLVVVRGMILARTFPVTVTTAEMAINQDLKALVPRPGLTPEFLAWLLRGTSPLSLSRLEEAAHGTKALRMEAWIDLQLPVPPRDEQQQIASRIEQQLALFDAVVNKTEKSIDLLSERRSALITAAVTGQIDLREAA